MTKEESIKMFREMWSDMADYIENVKRPIDVWHFKSNWLRERNIRCMSECPLCQYSYDLYCNFNFNSVYTHMCQACPIEWESDTDSFMCEFKHIIGVNDGLWVMCRDAETWQEQAALARKISELPEREDV